MKRNIYLQTLSIEQALEKVQQALKKTRVKLPSEIIPVEQALGRKLAKPIFARCSSPTFHAAAMDGIAVKAENTFGAREGSPKFLQKNKDFIEINTGNPLPSGFNAVIKIEDVLQVDSNTVSIERPAFPWQHVRRIGEDIVATELLFPQGHVLSAYDLGALLSAGIFEVKVQARVRVGIMPTGDEVLDFTLKPTPQPGQVIESNSQMFAALLTQWGCEPVRVPPVPDNPELLLKRAKDLLKNVQILIICAGSSAGSKDFTRLIMEKLGQIIVHGIKAMPGKPTLVGLTDQGQILVGAPGYPVSAIVCLEYLLKPLIYCLRGESAPEDEAIDAVLSKNLPSKLGIREFVRVGVGKVGKRYVAVPLPRGAGLVTSLSRATGLLTIAEQEEGIPEGTKIRVRLFKPKPEIDKAIIAIGSHDNLLDLLKDELMNGDNPLFLFSSHVGSLGGLQAIKKNYAHLAGTHLFDPQTEDYNFPFIQKVLPNEDVVLINLAIRKQGLIVARGNPKNIKNLKDLTRKDITFINRQQGAGTRILLDYYLKKLNIQPDQIKGYKQEEFTHMAVAVNVLTGTADCGLGILAAAKALNLDFIPLVDERYDLLIRREMLEDKRIKRILEIITSSPFKARAKDLGGYDLSLSGKIMQPKT
ncbi:MAG: molybdopterin biosynthesis protein [Desulfonauticus sp.]|nr:molybdopterin biosynthesis protein [Desulfonauticus sp.]